MRIRVLVVDDDPDIARLERRILQHAGYAVTTVGDDLAALAEIAQNPPDLVVTDLPLLRRHGRELWATLTSAGERRPALLVSGSTDDGPPGVPFLRRPFALTDLREAVAAALAAGLPAVR